jgi:NADPH:quinone reductase-like Zn-dependent oxidoreductase
MKAAVYFQYGPPDVVKVVELEKPVPKDDEVLIRVCAASVNPLDWRLLRGVPHILRILFRLPKPSVTEPGQLGRDVAGQVEAVGKNVTRFKPSDEVFGTCRGAIAEYACSSEATLARKSTEVTFEQAASVPIAGLTALQGLRDAGQLQPGQKVLINGAAGGVGTFAVQIAKWLGSDVTGVCSTRNMDLVRSLGAERVIDYTRENFTQSREHYDVILDNVGNHSLSALRSVLNPRGICVIAGAPKNPGFFLARMITAPVLSLLVGQKFVMLLAKVKNEDLTILGDLMATGKITPMIDRRCSLPEAAEALRYVEGGHARGKVVITVG